MKRPEKEDYGFYVGKTFYFYLEDGEKKYLKALEKYADSLAELRCQNNSDWRALNLKQTKQIAELLELSEIPTSIKEEKLKQQIAELKEKNKPKYWSNIPDAQQIIENKDKQIAELRADRISLIMWVYEEVASHPLSLENADGFLEDYNKELNKH